MATPWVEMSGQKTGPETWPDIEAMLDAWIYGRAPWSASEIEMYRPSEDGTLVHGDDAVHHKIVASGRYPRVIYDVRHHMAEGHPMLELGDDWKTPADSRRGMVVVYGELLHSGREFGAPPVGVADASCWNARFPGRDIVPDTPRYRHLERVLPGIRIGGLRVGFQTHHQNVRPLDDRYFEARLGIEQTLPLLLAPGCSSYHPDDRVMSKRYFSFSSLTSCGLFGWHTLADYIANLRELWDDDRRIHGPEDIHPWVKPCKGSTEVRICDTPNSVLDAIALHAVSYCLMEYYFRRVDAGERVFRMERPWQTGRLKQALGIAAAFGTSRPEVRLPSPFARGVASFEQLYSQLADMLRPIMMELGYDWEFRHFFHEMVANRQNGAEWQLQWREDEGLDDVEFLARSHAKLMETLEAARKRFAPDVTWQARPLAA